MNLRVPLFCSLALIAAMCGLSLWAWGSLPDGQSIAIHFDLDGTPNGFAGKAMGLLVVPLIAGFVTACMAFVPRLEPRRDHLAHNAGLFYTAWIGALLLLTFGHASLIAFALGHTLPMALVLSVLLAVFWIVLGWQLGRSRSTFFLGIRTPWTLSSDVVWEKTHRLAGRLFMLTGAITLLTCVLPLTHAALAVLLVGTLMTVAVATGASYVYWRRSA